MKQLTRAEMAAALLAEDNILILTHRRPDGDTIGSACALCRGLRQLGKTAFLYENAQFTEKYQRFLEGLVTAEVPAGCTIMSVDMATESLLPMNAPEMAGRIVLAVDHHSSNTGFSGAGLVEPEKAACGEIIYDLLGLMGVTVTKEIAEAIYLAVSTDTGCFRYANVTANTLRIAYLCKEAGADTFPINQTFFTIRRMSRLKLDAYLGENLQLFHGGLVGICTLPADVLTSFGITEDDIEDISGFPRQVEGVCVGAVLRELGPEETKVSVRTAPGYDAGAICEKLGGGGHKAAAGAVFAASLTDGQAMVLSAIEEILNTK